MFPSKRKGFTVIELLVAVGVTALLVTLMINIVSTVLTNWNRTSGSLSSGNQARLVLDQISQDLQGAILKTDGNVWLAASVQSTAPDTGTAGIDWDESKPVGGDSVSLAPSGSVLEDYRFGQGGVWLRFFTIPSGANDGTLETISAPRAVAYQIIRRAVNSDGSEPYVYQLFRSEVNPRETFEQGYNLYEDDGYNDSSGTTIDDGAVDNIRRPIADQVIASGIVDFGVRLFIKNTVDDRIVEVFPVDRRGALGAAVGRMNLAATTNTALSDPVNGNDVTYAFPTAAEVMIRVLTPEGIRLLEAKEDTALSGNIPQSWWEIVEQNSQVYTRRIDLKSTAL